MTYIARGVLLIGLPGFTFLRRGLWDGLQDSSPAFCPCSTSATHYICASAYNSFYTSACVYLWRCRSVAVAREYLQCDSPTAVFEHLLQLGGVVAHILSVHFLYDVAHMEQTLPVNHASVKDSSNDQVVFLHPKGHALKAGQRSSIMVLHTEFHPQFNCSNIY